MLRAWRSAANAAAAANEPRQPSAQSCMPAPALSVRSRLVWWASELVRERRWGGRGRGGHLLCVGWGNADGRPGSCFLGSCCGGGLGRRAHSAGAGSGVLGRRLFSAVGLLNGGRLQKVKCGGSECYMVSRNHHMNRK